MPGQPCLIDLAQKGVCLHPPRGGGHPRTILHTHHAPPPQQSRMRRRCAAGYDSALKAHDKLAVQAFLDLYSRSRVTKMVRRGKQLQGVLLIEHRVIFGDATLVLDEVDPENWTGD